MSYSDLGIYIEGTFDMSEDVQTVESYTILEKRDISSVDFEPKSARAGIERIGIVEVHYHLSGDCHYEFLAQIKPFPVDSRDVVNFYFTNKNSKSKNCLQKIEKKVRLEDSGKKKILSSFL
jgi:hypothetical protein